MNMTTMVVLLALTIEAVLWTTIAGYAWLVKRGKAPTIRHGTAPLSGDMCYLYHRIHLRGKPTPFVYLVKREMPVPEFLHNSPVQITGYAIQDFMQYLDNYSTLALNREQHGELVYRTQLWLASSKLPLYGTGICRNWRDQLKSNPHK